VYSLQTCLSWPTTLVVAIRDTLTFRSQATIIKDAIFPWISHMVRELIHVATIWVTSWVARVVSLRWSEMSRRSITEHRGVALL
jgi:hypothetical protein